MFHLKKKLKDYVFDQFVVYRKIKQKVDRIPQHPLTKLFLQPFRRTLSHYLITRLTRCDCAVLLKKIRMIAS